MYRNTYVQIDLQNIKENVQKIIKKYSNYKYYFGVVKADCYGHDDVKTVKAIIDGGCNYLCVATLEEALEIRKKIEDIPILCLGVILKDYIDICKTKNIIVTIPSLEYVKKLKNENIENLKVHIKINTGMNRLGIKESEELKEVYKILEKKKANIEGIYTHIYEANNKQKYDIQIEKFEELLENIPKERIPIIHTFASEAMSNYNKIDDVNGCRLGIIMYGFTENKELNLKSTFSLKSQIIQINNLKPGETVGYNGKYIAKENEKIAVVSIGYADGILRKNTGRTVFINEKEYKIVGNICMDMLFVKIDDTVKLYDTVEILKDIEHIESVAKYLDTIPYEVMCSIGKRVPRKYI